MAVFCFHLKVVGKFYKAALFVIAITSFNTIDIAGDMLCQINKQYNSSHQSITRKLHTLFDYADF
jgi:hypothetical protein